MVAHPVLQSQPVHSLVALGVFTPAVSLLDPSVAPAVTEGWAGFYSLEEEHVCKDTVRQQSGSGRAWP